MINDGLFKECHIMFISLISLLATKSKRHNQFDEIALSIVIHYLFLMLLVMFATPEAYRSTGLHQTVGDCEHVSYIHTVTGQVWTVLHYSLSKLLV